MTPATLAVHGRGVVPIDEPVLRADDLGVQRGDGIFETVRVAAGRPFGLGLHLRRLATSAARMDLAGPSSAEWAELAGLAVDAYSGADGALKLVLTRGVAGVPTAYALLLPVAAEAVAGRESGVRAVTLTLGVSAATRGESPWLLGGVKTTSYAVNMATLRHAESLGAQEAIWLSTEGVVLEAPTATVGWVTAQGAVCTPVPTTGILAGITLAVLSALQPIDVVAGTAADLASATEVFLCSSVRGVAPVVSLDGRELGVGAATAVLRGLYEDAVAGRRTVPGLELD